MMTSKIENTLSFFNRAITLTLLLFALNNCSSTPAARLQYSNIEKISQKYNIALENETDYPFYTINNFNGIDKLYFTAINDCRPKGTTLQSLLRQILVGFSRPTISRQTIIKRNNIEILQSFASANYKEQELNFIIYTFNLNDCTNDYVFWSESKIPELKFEQLTDFVQELAIRGKLS